jgi:hypothetical protein
VARVVEHPNAAALRHGYEAMLAGDFDIFAATLSPEVVWHHPGVPDPVLGRAAVVDLLRAQEIAGVDSSLTQVHDVMATDEHVCALVRVRLRCDDLSVSYLLTEVAHMHRQLVTERWAFMEAAPPEVTVFFAELAAAARSERGPRWLSRSLSRRRRAPRGELAPAPGSAGSGAGPG